jgi:hypothetical protein
MFEARRATMEHKDTHDATETRDILFLVGGATFLVLGAGLIITHPTVRKSVAAGLTALLPELQGRLGPNVSAIGPDLQRYLKLRAM